MSDIIVRYGYAVVHSCLPTNRN